MFFIKTISDKINNYCEGNNIKINLQLFLYSDKFITKLDRIYDKIDVVFLDIDMPNADGFLVASEIRKLSKSIIIIFVTSMLDKAYEGYTYNAFRFIRKQYFNDDFDKAIIEIFQEIKSNNVKYTFVIDNEIIKLSIDKILYFEVVGRDVNMLTIDKDFILKDYQLKKVIHALGNHGFELLYKGLLINMKHISKIDKKTVEIYNTITLEVARERLPKIKEMFLENERGCLL